jgi:beta-galactosidase
MRLLVLFILAGWVTVSTADEAVVAPFLKAIPDGYFLREYDDCGVEARQPHVQMQDCYLWTFGKSDTDAAIKERSAVFSYKGIQAVYTNLDPKLSYVLALTYASDHVYKRVQSLEVDGVVLHGPYALPMAKSTRVIVPVPAEVVRDGKMTLSWKIHGEVNATVSIVELWANAPSSQGLRISSLAGSMNDLQGQVLNLAYDGVPGAEVTLGSSSRQERLTAKTDAEGMFTFTRKAVETIGGRGSKLELNAAVGGEKGQSTVNVAGLFFDPVHYQPMPEKTGSLRQNHLLLDGNWWIDPVSTNAVRSRPLHAGGWSRWKVPGQWLQQGFDIPQEKPIAVTTEFVIPKEWSKHRIILRFDSIHAGTRYWLNGRELGYKENLFTPVEWDITEAARIGSTNRLDLEMKVQTLSEALSVSSSYAFHSLGGIDRSVHLFALPQTHIARLRVSPELDNQFHDADLNLNLQLESDVTAGQLSVQVQLQDSSGKTIKHSQPKMALGQFSGITNIDFATHVTAPRLWSAEKPNVYRMVIELRDGGTLLERVERQIGFRKLEIRGRQFYVNGQRVKLTGACHHEFDPLTGRADTMRHAETDVRLMKEANLNYIRTSHYPPPTELLDAADRLGMYVEVEAPFCWVGPALDDRANTSAILTPTSAMIDYHHSHPSVIVWSLANESHFNRQFLASAKMVKDLDPTRPTMFNHDFANSPLSRITDIANVHYPSMPFDKVMEEDSRPLFLGEYFFPICHEQTDVVIDPGLRELWGMGHAEPGSAFGQALTRDFEMPPLKPGLKPGGWSYITHSDRVIGGAIWASHDDAFYLSETNHVGYAWHHGFWGLIDFWRRPKPEWWLARHIFSPVWLETRHVPYVSGQKSVRVPVENRYAFTDLSELEFHWEINRQSGKVKVQLAPAAKGVIDISVPKGTVEGDEIVLHVTNAAGVVVEETAIQLGSEKKNTIPQLTSERPQWVDDGQKLVVQGRGFGLVFDRRKGDFDSTDARHSSAVTSFPSVHVTRYDFGDLNGPNSPNYAVFPEAQTRHFEKIDVKEEATGLRLTVHERFTNFIGSTSWLIDATGRGVVSCDYVYTGQPIDTREAGIRFLLKPDCEELHWRRWSEWGVFPAESISRTEGSARAHRDKKWDPAKWNQRPKWPWSQDETEMGTTDFRSIKYNVYEAGLKSPQNLGIKLLANADSHFRAAVSTNGTTADMLWRCPLGQVPMKSGDHLTGQFVTKLVNHSR